MRHCRAFTLIELLIVILIAGVLAALVYPSYAAHVIKARRIEGQTALLETMQKQERFYSQNNKYVAFSADSADPDAKYFRWFSGSSAEKSAYEISGHACENAPLERCVKLRAMPGTPKVDARFRDPECETLTLDSGGQHGATSGAPRCWP